jgi:hypothetical protein
MLEERYGELPAGEGVFLRLTSERVTWWRGFEVRTVPVGAEVG